MRACIAQTTKGADVRRRRFQVVFDGGSAGQGDQRRGLEGESARSLLPLVRNRFIESQIPQNELNNQIWPGFVVAQSWFNRHYACFEDAGFPGYRHQSIHAKPFFDVEIFILCPNAQSELSGAPSIAVPP